MAAAVAVHQGQQFFDVARADVDDHVIDDLQVLLQLGELAATDDMAICRSCIACPARVNALD